MLSATRKYTNVWRQTAICPLFHDFKHSLWHNWPTQCLLLNLFPCYSTWNSWRVEQRIRTTCQAGTSVGRQKKKKRWQNHPSDDVKIWATNDAEIYQLSCIMGNVGGSSIGLIVRISRPLPLTALNCWSAPLIFQTISDGSADGSQRRLCPKIFWQVGWSRGTVKLLGLETLHFELWCHFMQIKLDFRWIGEEAAVSQARYPLSF